MEFAAGYDRTRGHWTEHPEFARPGVCVGRREPSCSRHGECRLGGDSEKNRPNQASPAVREHLERVAFAPLLVHGRQSGLGGGADAGDSRS